MKTQDIVFTAQFAAIVAVLGLIPKIQLAAGVPITAQSLGVMLAGGILGAKRGGLALMLFVVLVLAGLPLLAGGRGGFGLLAGPSGGFLLAFPIGAWVVGYLVERFWLQLNIVTAMISALIGGMLVLYLIGIPWMAWTLGVTGAKAYALVLPFFPGDLIKAVIAGTIILTIKKAYPLIQVAGNRPDS